MTTKKQAPTTPTVEEAQAQKPTRNIVPQTGLGVNPQIILGHDPDGYPVVAAWHCQGGPNDQTPLVRFFCPFCGTWHQHGGSGPDRGAGHRVSHCFWQESPLKPLGYILQVIGDLTPDVEKALERHWRPQARAWQQQHPRWWEVAR